MDELRRLQVQLRRMRQNGSPATDCYQLWRKIERLKYQLALGCFRTSGIRQRARPPGTEPPFRESQKITIIRARVDVPLRKPVMPVV